MRRQKPTPRLSGAEPTAGEQGAEAERGAEAAQGAEAETAAEAERGVEAETRGSSGSLVAESETEEHEQVPKGSSCGPSAR